MEKENAVAVINSVAAVEGRVVTDYSGRGMYGRICYGIITDDPEACVRAARAKGLTGAYIDNMGLSMIVYWPSVEGDHL